MTLGAFTPGDRARSGQRSGRGEGGRCRTSGPLAHELVTALSQKAAGTGAVATDTQLAPGTELFTIELDLVAHAPTGVVFDGTASGFLLPSGGMRDRLGTTVVEAKDVAIGKLELLKAD